MWSMSLTASETKRRGLLDIAQCFDAGFKQFDRIPGIVGDARNHAGRHHGSFTDDRQNTSTHAQLLEKGIRHSRQ